MPNGLNTNATPEGTSSVTIDVETSTTYFIAIDGEGGQSGDYRLNYRLGGSNATIRWAAARSGNWNRATNWKDALTGRNRLPEPRDYIAIDVPGTYSVSLDVNAKVAGIAALGAGSTLTKQSLTISGSGRTLTVAGSSVVRPGGELNVQPGGSVVLNSTMKQAGTIFWSGGKLSGTGKIENTGRTEIAGASAKSLSQLGLENIGTIVWSGAGSVLAGNGADITNRGRFNVTVPLSSTALLFGWDGKGERPKFNNVAGGTIMQTSPAPVAGSRTRGGQTRAIGGILAFARTGLYNNGGRVEVNNGTLRVEGGGQGAGTFTPRTTGSTIDFRGDVFRFERGRSTLAGAGRTRVSGNSFQIDDAAQPISVSVQNMEIAAGGNISGADDLIATGKVLWTGGRMSGSGQTVINRGATLEIAPSTTSDLQGRRIRNQGTMLLTNATLLKCGSGAKIDNEGSFAAPHRGGFAFNNAGTPLLFTNKGALHPGNRSKTGTLSIGGDWTQVMPGALNIELGGVAAGQFDQLAISRTATLGGTLAVSLRPGFVPVAGTRLTILTAAAIKGRFGTVKLPAGWTLSASARSLVLLFAGTTATPSVNQSVPESGVRLSSAARRGDLLLLTFTGALDAGSATEAARYEIQAGGRAVAIASMAYFERSHTVAIELAPQSTLEASIAVRWRDLRDARGRNCSGETVLNAGS